MRQKLTLLFGRIAAQAARSCFAKNSPFEKDRIFDDFKDTVGDIVTGQYVEENADLLIDLGKGSDFACT